MSEKWLKDILKSKGFSSNMSEAIARKAEEQAKKDTIEKEMKDREKALGLTMKLVNEALGYRKEHGQNTPPSQPKKTIIIPNE